MTKGRRTKLTAELQQNIVDLILRGFTLKAAAIHSGITERLLYYWMGRGRRSGKGEFFQFFQSVESALKKRKTVEIKANPRHLARARYEHEKSATEIAMLMAEEIDRMVVEGRVPWNVALVALASAQAEIEDKLAEESLSWAENFTPAYDNDRARMEEDE